MYMYICMCVYIYIYMCVYVIFHPKETKYTFFSNAHRTFSRIKNMVRHETSLKKFNKLEIISSIFLDHKGMKLESNLRKTQASKTLKLMEIE